MLKGFNQDSFGNNVWFHTNQFFTKTLLDRGFQSRDGQYEMTMDIMDTLGGRGANQVRVVEAGVGIGKSYAYLVPALFAKKARPSLSLIISTGTISLQEQLVQDIRKVSSLMNMRFKVLLAKGQSHFLCKKKAERFYQEQDTPEWFELIDDITEYGDRAIIEAKIRQDIGHWNRLNVDESCTRTQCTLYGVCGYMRLRTEMRDISNVIVTNHDQLLRDRRQTLAYGRPLFHTDSENRQVRDLIILDEVHTLEEKSRAAESIQINLKWMNNVLDKAIFGLEALSTFSEIEELKNQAKQSVKKTIDIIYSQCKDQFTTHERNGEFPDRYRIIPEDLPISTAIKQIRDLNNSVQLHSKWDIDDVIQNLEYMDNFLSLFEHSDDDSSPYIYWAEMNNKSYASITLNRIPKDMAEVTSRLLFDRIDAKYIMTSATITGPGDTNEEKYEYFLDSNGISLFRTQLSDPQLSPFNYTEKTLLYIPTGLPHPNERESLCQFGAEKIYQLLQMTSGRAMILFTAKQDMKRVHELLAEKDMPWKLLIQESAGSQNQIREEFKSDEHSILLSTGSFWEGIDVPGPSLSNLVIFKLPFPVSDPIYEYKISQVEKPMEILLPEMLIKLRQGLGRLIRHENDKGIATILDTRLTKEAGMSYRNEVLKSIPFTNVTESIGDVKSFCDSIFV